MEGPGARLLVRVVEARGLARAKGEVYVTLEVGKTKKKTPAVKLGSMWNASLSFEQTDEPLNVAVYAKELFRDDLLGSAVLLIKPLPSEWSAYTLPLEKRAKKKDSHKDSRRSSDAHALPERTGELVLQLRMASAGDAGLGSQAPEDGWVVVDAKAPSGDAAPQAQPQTHVDRMPSPAAANAEALRLNSASKAAEEAERRKQEAENERLLAEFLAAEYVCNVCRNGVEPAMLLAVGPACAHQACVTCLSAHTRSAVVGKSQREGVACIVSGCVGKCSDGVLMQTLAADVFDGYIASGLEELVSGGKGAFFRCPKCQLVMERIAAPRASSSTGPIELDTDGKPLTLEARTHKAEFRFRCRAEACVTEFCAGCGRVPYHLGRTCEQFTAYMASRHCRYCQAVLSAAVLPECDVCAEGECVAKRNAACTQRLGCGHACGGVRDEKACLPCLEEECAAHKAVEPPLSQSSSDFCNICWVEELGAAPSVRLECGHVFHHGCVLKKLREKWPHARITFGFLSCPLCKQRIAHASLADELKPVLALYEDLRGKALQRLEFEGMKKDHDVAHPTGRYHNRPADYAMDKFAYYPCYQCKKAYFGGQRRCDAGEQNRPFDPKDLICGACAGGALATTCAKHGNDYIEYKCQFCCAIATWFCWGKTHFCEECHTRQQKGDYVSKKPKSELPVCPGIDKCPLKRRHPPNGDEYSFGCVLCANEREF